MTVLSPTASEFAERTLTEPNGPLARTPKSGLALQLRRPTNTSAIVHIDGELDTSTAPSLHELLASRPASTAETLILDLSEVRFLGVAGLQLLAHVHRLAASRAAVVRIVDGPVCVDRALRAAGWNETIPTWANVTAALDAANQHVSRHSPH